MNTFVLPESERISDCIPQNAKMFKKGTVDLDQYSAKQDHFIEDRFTVTDIIIGYTLNWAKRRELVKEFQFINDYLERMLSR